MKQSAFSKMVELLDISRNTKKDKSKSDKKRKIIKKDNSEPASENTFVFKE